MPTKNFLLRPDETLIARLTEIAELTGDGTANQVALRIIEEFANDYIAIRQVEKEAREQYRAQRFEHEPGKAHAAQQEMPRVRRKVS